MTARRCQNRSHPQGESRWHDKRDPCPYCGDETSPHSKHLHTSMLNNHLYGEVERQRKDIKTVVDARKEYADVTRKYGH